MHSSPTEALGARSRPRHLRTTAVQPADALPAGRLVISLEDGSVIEDHGRDFESFYLEARTSIARALSLALGDVDLALEATDEAMARAYERWPTVARLDRPEGWVYRVAMNWALSILRRRKRSQHRLYDPSDASVAIADPDVHAALGELDVKHRSVIVCRHLLGWSVAETAGALKIREGTVKSRLHRAHLILQARLRHLNEEQL
jgi:RNA polymerase sigma-70 factor (ECF subfamily)